MNATIDELERYSARWGADFGLVQGAGGNTSLKLDDRMCVKASGFRLADALRQSIFIDVLRTEALAMADGGPTPVGDDGRRASIETSLHGVIPQPIVTHLHMVALIAIAIRADAEAVLKERLEGLRWGFVPYLKPGVAVAGAVRKCLAERGPLDVIVLANHGIVFAAENFETADRLVENVRARLEVKPRVGANPDNALLAMLADRFGLEPARLPQAHWAALDRDALTIATAGSLYPDHVVFLGRSAARLMPDDNAVPVESLLALVPGAGALLTPGLGNEAHEMAACLGEVVCRVPGGTPLRVLSRDEEDALVNWDAEIYRRDRAIARSVAVDNGLPCRS